MTNFSKKIILSIFCYFILFGLSSCALVDFFSIDFKYPKLTATPISTTAPSLKSSIVPYQTITPTPTITIVATIIATSIPTIMPSLKPTVIPTSVPTPSPTLLPTVAPTIIPIQTIIPTATPTVKPTITPTSIPSPTATPNTYGLSTTKTPGKNFDLSWCKLQTPISNGGTGVIEIYNPALTTFASSNFYTESSTGAIVFYVPSDGAHTSGSLYPRSELRQLTDFYCLSCNTSITVICSVDQIPSTGRICIGQMKGEDEQAVELYFKNNYLYAATKPTWGGSITNLIFASTMSLGQIFTYSMSNVNGLFTVTVNGVTKSIQFDSTWDLTHMVYWKCGNYLQDNITSPTTYGQVSIYSVSVLGN